MALKATVFKAELQISDMGRNYYAAHALTIARHPSESDERMMVRLLAFALHAHEFLTFADGMNSDDEPALWQKDPTGIIDTWIDVGQPDEKRVRKACGRAKQVFIYTYSGHSADVWWRQISEGLERIKNLTVTHLTATVGRDLAKLVQRTMQLHCTIQDGQVWMGDKNETVQVDLKQVKNGEGE